VPDAERNRERRESHGTKGLPTVLLLTADGEVCWRRPGYRAADYEGPNGYAGVSLEQRRTVRPLALEARAFMQHFEAAGEFALPERA